jgi:hypothetical protein
MAEIAAFPLKLDIPSLQQQVDEFLAAGGDADLALDSAYRIAAELPVRLSELTRPRAA